MGIPTHTKFERHLEKILLAANKQIDDLAAQYRSSVLLPLCRKHKVGYYTVNRSCWFKDRSGTCVWYDFEAVEKGMPWAVEVFKTLELKNPTGDHFGDHIECIPL